MKLFTQNSITQHLFNNETLRRNGFLFLLLIALTPAFAQNKTEKPNTFKALCFFTVDKEGFKTFEQVQKNVWSGNFRAVLPAIKEMQKDLKKFSSKSTDRSFELWYNANYTDFDDQVEVTRQATLTALDTYKDKLQIGTARYYDHRLFLMHYLAFKTEVYYPNYWFMSQERFFSHNLTKRLRKDNPEAGKLFEYSDFYTSFDPFDRMLKKEEEDMKEYLGINESGSDTTGIGNQPLIPYSYAVLRRDAAQYIIQHFTFDDATMDLNTDREVRALKRFILRAKANEIWLLVRFNEVPFGQAPQVQPSQN